MQALRERVARRARRPDGRRGRRPPDRRSSAARRLLLARRPGPDARRDEPPLPDGVACFNGMYLKVTEAVRDALPSFENQAFVERLDVLFAQFYFEAYDAAAAQAWVSKAWAAAVRAPRRAAARRPPVRDRGHERPHQQRPRARARPHLEASWAWRRHAERRDYEKVNGILEAVETRHQGPALRRPDRRASTPRSASTRRLPRPVEHPRTRATRRGSAPGSCATCRGRARRAVRPDRRLRRQSAAAARAV